jgi:hypothetical protein
MEATQPRTLLPLVEGDGYCAVVGESHYQHALGGTASLSSLDEDGERRFQALLVREPDNPHDSNAIAVFSTQGKLGYLSREDAEASGRSLRRLPSAATTPELVTRS